MIALLLVSGSLGMTNFTAALAIGFSGVDARLRLRVAIAFGLFEAGMPLLGLLLGRQLAGSVGAHSNLVAATLLGPTGAYTILAATRQAADDAVETSSASMPRLLATGLSLSIDNLVVGFALGTYHVSFAVAATVIAVISVGMSLVGLELGSRLGHHLGPNTDLLAGAILIAVGGAIAVGVI
jgi:putative Mn2+ efflux pump MntP